MQYKIEYIFLFRFLMKLILKASPVSSKAIRLIAPCSQTILVQLTFGLFRIAPGRS